MPSSRPLRETNQELRLWKSNHVLPEETQRRIHDLTLDAQVQLDQLNAKIAKTFSPALLYQRHKERARLAALIIAVAPWKKVPAEILGEIFVWYNVEHGITFPVVASRNNPWLPGHICSHWRNIFWSTSEAWTEISIIQYLSNKRLTAAIKFIDDTVFRVNRPISVELQPWKASDDAIVDSVFASLPHFKSLEIGLNCLGFQTLLDLPPSSLASLKSLVLHVDDMTSTFPDYHTTSLHHAPSLQKYHFHGDCSVFLPQLLLLPWGQLTDVCFPDMNTPPSVIYSILEQCTSLTVCELCIGIEPARGCFGRRNIVVPNLRAVTFTPFRDSVVWSDFLAPFVFPALKELSIKAYDNPLSLYDIPALIKHSKCSLQELTVSQFIEPDASNNLNILLQSVPSLVYLNANSLFPPHVLRDISNGTLLPQIKWMNFPVLPLGLETLLHAMEGNSQDSPSSFACMHALYIHCYPGLGSDVAYKKYANYSGKWGQNPCFHAPGFHRPHNHRNSTLCWDNKLFCVYGQG